VRTVSYTQTILSLCSCPETARPTNEFARIPYHSSTARSALLELEAIDMDTYDGDTAVVCKTDPAEDPAETGAVYDGHGPTTAKQEDGQHERLPVFHRVYEPLRGQAADVCVFRMSFAIPRSLRQLAQLPARPPPQLFPPAFLRP
jgi:hypothetical protein